jgi:uncharacterized protein
MNSSIYRASVFHKRVQPKRFFKYKIFWFHVFLDELDELKKRFRFFSYNRFNLYNFKDLDHFSYPKGAYHQTLAESVKAYVKDQGEEWESDFRISIITNLRTLGYNFNPVSFIYIWKGETCKYCIVEIGNTFNEQKPFFLKELKTERNQFVEKHQKLFYVSPFFAHDLYFEFNIGVPNQKLKISINDVDEKSEKVFFTGVDGIKQKLSAFTLFKSFLSIPMIPLYVITQIHFQAFILWFKKVPYFRKNEFVELQQDIYHPKST